MISATALNASTVPLNKSPQMPLGLDNSRLRVDSQKFLVPSLPVSSRQINPRVDHHSHHHNHNPHLHYQHSNGGAPSANDPMGVSKRRERSILNGTAHPIPPPENRLAGTGLPGHNLNGLRRPSSPLGGKGSSPNYPHMQSSPRKDAHSPMYAGEVPGFSGSPGSTFSARSSVPIPCSSPSPGASASPKSSHSLSPNGGCASSGSATYSHSPHLPPGMGQATNGANELSQLAVAAAAAAAATGGRLYPPGFPPPTAAAAHHAAFYAAAAAAAGHSLPYPGLFGSPYSTHQHPAAAAAASSYLDFHSKLLRNSAAAAVAAADLRSPSQSPPSRSYHQASPHQQQQAQPPSHILQPLGSPQSTSVTSLHTKLIESVSAAGDRYHPQHTGHNHNHIHSGGNNGSQQQHPTSHSRFPSHQAGVSKGGPLGISGGIMGLSISPNSNSPHKGHSGSSATSASADMSSKSGGGKMYMEHPGLPGNSNSNCINSSSSSTALQERKLLAEMELINGNKGKESALAKQRMLTRSPEDFSTAHHQHQHHQHQLPQKIAKSISFASDVHSGGMHRPIHHSYINGHGQHHHPQHTQQLQHQHHHHHQTTNSSGPTNLSTDCKRANGSNSMHPNSSPAGGIHTSHQNHMFLPPSPKKRSAHWNFAVPQSPVNNGKNGDLLPPPPPPASDSLSETVSMLNASPSKYLSQNQQNQKPSNGGPGPMGMAGGGAGAPPVAAAPNHYHQSTNAQQLLVVPSSPLSSSSSSHGGSGPSTPKSPSVHFKFFSSTNKENAGAASSGVGRNGRILNARNDSSSSTSSVELGVINGNGKIKQTGPWPVEQMPLITAFRKGSMIKLASGDLKAVEDLREEDFEKAVQMVADSVKIVHCHVISIQESGDSSLCKVTLAMGAAHNQQVVVDSTPEQPFFIRGRGWSSSSPKLTEKLLQLPCATLAVGDICITLTRNVRSQSNSVSSGGVGNHNPSSGGGRGSKSKSGTTRPYGTYSKNRNSSTSSILKSSHQLQQRGNNCSSNVMRMNGRKHVSGSGTTTNLDVNNSANNTTGPATSTNPITPTRPNEKTLSVTEEKRERKTAGGKEVDFSVSNSTPTTPTSTAKSSIISSSETNSHIESPSQTKEPSTWSMVTPAAAVVSKRKSISPGPLGSSRKDDGTDNERNDEGMRPPSPKKRRWSAPDQIELEQNSNSSGDAATHTNPTTTSDKECCRIQQKENMDSEEDKEFVVDAESSNSSSASNSNKPNQDVPSEKI